MSPIKKGYEVEVPEPVISDNMEADVVVFGGGGSGLPAALTALEQGAKKIIVLEKRFATGGDGLRCNHIFAIGTHLQQEAGNTQTKDYFVNKSLEYHHCSKVKSGIIRAFVHNTAGTIHWLEKQGIEFKLLVSHFQGSDVKTVTTHVEKHMPEPDSLCSLGRIFRQLTQNAADAGVQFLLRTKGKRIKLGADGKVASVIAETRNGKEIEIKTKAVILSTGDFVGNKELVKKHFPKLYVDNYVGDGLMTNTGDGLPIAAEIGAVMAEPIAMGHAGSPPTVVNNQHIGVGPVGVRINANGERFFAENYNMIIEDFQFKQPGKVSYSLFDDKMLQASADKTRPPQHPRIPTPPETWIDARKYVQKFANRGEWVKMANSWDEIAEWIGCDGNTLTATIDKYNSFCDKGNDDDFGKDKQYLVPLRNPPYYAVLSGVNIGGTIGGIMINERMEVVDDKDNPVPGVFASGSITSGWTSCAYTAPGMAGSALSYAMTSGRIAGESAAKYVLGK